MLCLQFEKPGRREDFDYPDMAKEAGKEYWSTDAPCTENLKSIYPSSVCVCVISLSLSLSLSLSPATKALKDAKVDYSDIEQAVVGYVYGTFEIE